MKDEQESKAKAIKSNPIHGSIFGGVGGHDFFIYNNSDKVNSSFVGDNSYGAGEERYFLNGGERFFGVKEIEYY